MLALGVGLWVAVILSGWLLRRGIVPEARGWAGAVVAAAVGSFVTALLSGIGGLNQARWSLEELTYAAPEAKFSPLHVLVFFVVFVFLPFATAVSATASWFVAAESPWWKRGLAAGGVVGLVTGVLGLFWLSL